MRLEKTCVLDTLLLLESITAHAKIVVLQTHTGTTSL